MEQNLLKDIQLLFTSGKNILVLTRKNPGVDSIAAALALFKSFSQSGKITSIACPTPLTVEFSNLFGIDKVETKIGNKNLVISLDYIEGSIEKVSYNVEGDKFNLVIQPKEGFPPFSKDKVHYSYSGTNADVIFTVDTQRLEDLDDLFFQNKDIFEKVPLVNIDNNRANTNFGKINFIDPSASSCSLLIFQLLTYLHTSFDTDIASNLLTGIETATDGFRSLKTTALDFEAAAFCLRKGAQRVFLQKGATEPQKISQPPPDWLQPKIYKGGQLL